ncbi:MAG: hypothetical protein A2X58_02345 [Nitrospirae bacterium GWC2_56_14]|nr:MAG: hypothetical protein A2X58_02345 [Nitrospirae bacterium GWC2_56_14]
MKNQRGLNVWSYALLLALLSVISMPLIAGAAALVSQVPTGPKDINGNWATPDYYTTANWANSPPLAKFVDTLPGLGSTKPNNLGQYLPVAVPDITTYPGTDYYEIELVEFTEQMHSDLTNGTRLRGYIQVNKGTNLKPNTLPSQGLCGADGHLCTAADTGVGRANRTPHYLGDTIVAERDRPVRLKFTNRLPAGTAGDLFIPVDTTVMGAGPGPAKGNGVRGEGIPCDNTSITNANGCDSYPQNRATIHLHGGRTPWISDGTPHQWITPVEEITPFTKGVSLQNVPDMPDPGDGSSTYYYTNQQSARLMFYHDHAFGITRLNVYAGEAAGYLITDQYEQDLISRGIIPSDQIPLVIQDKTFVDATPVTHPVTGETNFPKIRVTDPLWNWGSGPVDGNGIRAPKTGDLWLPHVYMPAQTSTAGTGGVNPFGRWMYGPWFYPATAVDVPPQPNPYYDLNCSSTNPFILAECMTPGQPEQIPGTPNVSMGMEAFQDSAVVNGTVFPTLTVDPRAYRFRILNAASDRFWNLSFYVADNTAGNVSPDPRLNPGANYVAGRSNQTEVKMALASAALSVANNWPPLWPVDGRDGGVPDPGTCTGSGDTLSCPNLGPSFLQIASEGGFLPKPVKIDPQPITYNTDPTAFWVGNVDKMGLAVGPAERADVIVDFSQYAGKTLILYNDAPAAWPARVAGYDYYTHAPDLRDSGGFGTGGTFDPATGAWSNGTGPLPGYAPNTRTVMQVIVRGSLTAETPNTYNYVQANLEKEFTAAAPAGKTLFERSQEPIIVGQVAYKDAYPNSYFPTNFPWEGINQINDQFLKFYTLAGEQVEAVAEPKGIHDEMGASFDPVYGRMSGNLAMQIPNPTTLTANLILYGFSDVPTETIKNSISADVQVNAGAKTLADGTQIWKVSHNGVDTHPIHFHIFDVQLINRVGWDGQILMPEPNELGWKDTVKISPLEDTIVAVRPRAPALPFGIPNSIRPLNPAIPINSAMGFNSIDPTTGQAYVAPSPYAAGVTNILYNFGWEYVWHCHILSHEEMDMMRPIVLEYIATPPPDFTATATPAGGSTINIAWIDPTPVTAIPLDPEAYRNSGNEIGYNVWRSNNGGEFVKLNATALRANSTTYSDTTATPGSAYIYKVEAFNAAVDATNTYIGSTFSSVANALSVTVSATNGPAFVAPATVNLQAIVGTIPAGMSVTQVAFYSGANLVGFDANTTAPFTYSWTNVPNGTYNITAKVTTNLGLVSESAPIMVTVTGALTANFTATGSANGADIGFCETVTFASTSTATSGSITGYSWLINGINYASNPVSTSLPLGANSVVLGIIDSATGETAQITKNVTTVNHNPIASAGGPYTVVPGESLTLNGSGTDLLDSCNATPLTYAWNVDNKGPYDFFTANPTISFTTLQTVLGVGTHTMTLKVTDSNGGVGTATTTLSVYGVSLTSSIVSHQLPGTPVSFTAAAAGGSGNYEYRFQLKTGASWAIVQNFSANAVWNWNTNTVAPGTYEIQVDARSVGSTTISSNSVSYVIDELLALAPSPLSPQFPGAAISLTALAGGPGNFEYQFWLHNGIAWKKVQDFSSNAIWNWNTATAAPGTYRVQVNARVVGTTTNIFKQVSFVINAPPVATNVTLTTSPASPQILGTPVSFTGAAAGGSGNYEYRFQLKTGATWATVQNFSTNAVWNWNTNSVLPGTYSIQVDARSVGSTATVSSVIDYVINIPLTLTPSPVSPQIQGSSVSFTSLADGPFNYEYQFWLHNGIAWKKVQDFSANAIWNWNTVAATPGTYWIQVNARVAGTTTNTFKQVSFVINAPPVATNVTLTTSPASPRLPGTQVFFTGAAAGGTGFYEYQFWLHNGIAWKKVQDFSSNAIWNWDTATAAPGTYRIQVNARTVGTTTNTFKQVSFVINAPPVATNVTLATSPASPQLFGTPVSFTGTAAGGSGNYEYRFQLKTGATWATVQNFSTNAVWNWNTTSVVPGTYSIQVDARSVGSTATVSSVIDYVINIPSTLTPSPVSPQVQGTSVSFTSLAGGPFNYEYQFWLHNGIVWKKVQDFSTNAIWNWNTVTAVPGTYWIQVNVRVVGTTTNFSKQVNYVIN